MCHIPWMQCCLVDWFLPLMNRLKQLLKPFCFRQDIRVESSKFACQKTRKRIFVSKILYGAQIEFLDKKRSKISRRRPFKVLLLLTHILNFFSLLHTASLGLVFYYFICTQYSQSELPPHRTPHGDHVAGQWPRDHHTSQPDRQDPRIWLPYL